MDSNTAANAALTEGRIVRLEVTVEQHGKTFEIVHADMRDVRSDMIPPWRFKIIERVVLLAVGGAATLLGMFIKQELGF